MQKEVTLKPSDFSDDPGQHYRTVYRHYLDDEDKRRGYVDIQFDPFRIAALYRMASFALQTILKKCLKAGDRGHKDKRQDLRDIISAAERELQIMDEDARNKVLEEKRTA